MLPEKSHVLKIRPAPKIIPEGHTKTNTTYF